jgi:hypothetical protein
MRDILEDVQRLLNDNKYMSTHAILSQLANEIVQLRCEIHRLDSEYKSLWWEHQQCLKEKQ